MYTIRGGPRTLLIQTSDIVLATESLKNHPDTLKMIAYAPTMKADYEELFNLAEERMTIVHLTHQMKPLLNFEQNDFEAIFLLDKEMDALLIELINNKTLYPIAQVRTGPKLVVMKVIGDPHLFFEAVQSDISATPIQVSEIYESVSSGTLILFTAKGLSHSIRLDQMNLQALYTKAAYSEIKKLLTSNQLKYINAALSHKDWYEYKIKIYDAYGDYKKHYLRLSRVIDNLNLGFILGESWGTDAALAFLAVGVYNVRLLSFMEPEAFKKILLAIEYDSEGHRLVDFDLFYKRRKVSWTDLRVKGLKTREETSLYYRAALQKSVLEDEGNPLTSL